jgi:hypothetical protein
MLHVLRALLILIVLEVRLGLEWLSLSWGSVVVGIIKIRDRARHLIILLKVRRNFATIHIVELVMILTPNLHKLLRKICFLPCLWEMSKRLAFGSKSYLNLVHFCDHEVLSSNYIKGFTLIANDLDLCNFRLVLWCLWVTGTQLSELIAAPAIYASAFVKSDTKSVSYR